MSLWQEKNGAHHGNCKERAICSVHLVDVLHPAEPDKLTFKTLVLCKT